MANGRDRGGYRPQRQGQGHGRGQRQRRTLDTADIRFTKNEEGNLDTEIFNRIAQGKAAEVARCGREINKSTQLRRFYDEIVMWEEKARQHPGRFGEFLPFIRMLNAKAAYAEGRKLVDGAFVDLIAHCVGQVNDADDMRIFKLFFEAFMGFYKLEKD